MKQNRWYTVSWVLLSTCLLLTGINHFRNPGMYLRIMPPWLPYKVEMNAVTGILEIAFALLLILPHTRTLGAWLIVALLIAIFPANVQMALNWSREENPRLWLAVLRLPLQALLIWWAYGLTKRKLDR